MALMGDRSDAYRVLVGRLREIDHLENLGLEETTMMMMMMIIIIIIIIIIIHCTHTSESANVKE